MEYGKRLNELREVNSSVYINCHKIQGCLRDT